MIYSYVISTNGQDLYVEQLYLSIRSLLLHNPNAEIYVVCDDSSKSHIVSSKWNINDMISKLINVKLDPTISTKVRSRLLKTSLRNYISGSFLYIDSDTVVVDKLVMTEDIQSIGAVYNTHSKTLQKSPNLDTFAFYLNKINEKITIPIQYNGGVIYVKDNNQARLFFEHWHNLYIYLYNQYGIDFDQLSLYLTNNHFGGLIQPLSGIWNCQLRYGINYLRDAKIIHFLTTTSLCGKHQAPPIHILQDPHLYLNMRNGLMDVEAIDEILINVMSKFTSSTRIKTADYNIHNYNLLDIIKKHGSDFIIYDDYHDEIAYKAIKELGISIVEIWNSPHQVNTDISVPILAICSIDRTNIIMSEFIDQGIRKVFFYYH